METSLWEDNESSVLYLQHCYAGAAYVYMKNYNYWHAEKPSGVQLYDGSLGFESVF